MLSEAVMHPFEMTGGSDLPETVARCREGDAAAWKRLYDQHFDFAWRAARRLGVPEAEVEDTVHEAFEVAFRKLDDFGSGQFSTWLYRIVANLASGRLKRRRVRDFFHSLWATGDEPQGPSLEGTVAARRALGQVEQVLRQLSTEKREVFALHELEGLTHEEISRLTGVKAETVRTRLFYAKKDFERLARKRGLLP